MTKLINNQDVYEHLVKKEMKLYDYLKKELVLSLRQTNLLMKVNHLKVNHQTVKKNIMLHKNDIIRIEFINEEHHYQPQDISLDIIYETDDLLVINKKPGMVVHETKTHTSHTIANAISYHFKKLNLKRKIRFVNRLDMDTSGLLIIAKNSYAHQFIAKQFDNEDTSKYYLALIKGHLENEHYKIDKSIKKDESKYIVDSSGKSSETIIDVQQKYQDYSLVSCLLKTGRTHQIRVHLENLGCPILGDELYGGQSHYINRQALHASQFTFIEPRTYESITIKAPLPSDMSYLIKNV